ncbi:hypothetical protein BHYA_0426g00050 [Botrytis hyacinthi]|uniref:Uncharacterized protein n=1 Tax=Botrytis hyacinthi TaxID=278943 RepID=A0A4Z1G423_9HELO|nr:hypothetical protein BHYA_0426g00050 [Botrytis hyacinthi]
MVFQNLNIETNNPTTAQILHEPCDPQLYDMVKKSLRSTDALQQSIAYFLAGTIVYRDFFVTTEEHKKFVAINQTLAMRVGDGSVYLRDEPVDLDEFKEMLDKKTLIFKVEASYHSQYNVYSIVGGYIPKVEMWISTFIKINSDILAQDETVPADRLPTPILRDLESRADFYVGEDILGQYHDHQGEMTSGEALARLGNTVQESICAKEARSSASKPWI